MTSESQTLTFLFTDVEGSTRLWEQQPDEMRDAIAQHDALLRGAVEAASGTVVKTMGDGMLALFATPTAALDAAIGAQRDLDAAKWSTSAALRVRMAIHAGPATERDGDYFGTTLNRAARIMALAHGGQVLASEAVAVLVRDHVPPGVKLRDLGEHRLRDLAQSERVFQVEADRLTVDFPPLRSLDAYPSNLPLQVTSFVGREREIEDLSALVRRQRLVTLTGVGGVGKTRLALRVAAELIPDVRDGVWLCELATADVNATVPDVVAQALAVAPRAGMTLEQSIVDALRDRELIVVLDNCEHVLDAAADLAAALLRSCARVRLLATSREGLGVDGEQLRPVRSLDVPNAPTAAAAVASDATALFLERAVATAPSFTLDDRNVAAVVEICRRLDGIPLAIELAAARVGSLQPNEIASLLDERFRLLTGNRRRTVERHQTLRATVDWSYSLLSDRDRAVFDRTGVFTGSFDGVAAQAVAGDETSSRFDVLDALDELVAKSMLNAEVAASSDTTRYQLLETLRQYALDRLDQEGTADRFRRRHAEHYATVTTDIGPRLYTTDEIAARGVLIRESDNIRAAIDWSIDTNEPEIALALVAPIASEAGWNRSGEIGAWASRALALESSDPDPRWAWVRVAAAYWLFNSVGDYGRALTRAEEVIRWESAPPDARMWAHTLRGIATSLTRGAELGLAAFAEAFEDLPADTGPNAMGCLASYAIFLGLSGATDLALVKADEALGLGRAMGAPSALALAHYTRGLIFAQTDPSSARRDLEAALHLSAAGASSDIVRDRVPHTVALIALRERDVVGAAYALGRALEYSLDIGDYSTCASELILAPIVLGAHGRLETVLLLDGAFAAGVLPQPSGNPGYADLNDASNAAVAEAATALAGDADGARQRAASMRRDEIVRAVIGDLVAIAADGAGA
jgi:predicted ATPase/class 3 adenylate cyclase